VFDQPIPPAATLQLYPGNARKDCFYTLDPGMQICVYVRNEAGAYTYKGVTSMKDDYVYFKANDDSVAVYAVVCQNKLEADNIIIKL
jgi:hypothetical protein